MGLKKIVITGGPGTGKTAVVNKLKKLGHHCFEEISRQITLEAKKQGIDQLFLTDSLLFSQGLMQGRKQQFKDAVTAPAALTFLDRGMPDIVAYMDYIGDQYPKYFEKNCTENRYDIVFMLPPWKEIYKEDNERYESFEQAQDIHTYLEKAYINYGYTPIIVPFGTIEERTNFILDTVKP